MGKFRCLAPFVLHIRISPELDQPLVERSLSISLLSDSPLPSPPFHQHTTSPHTLACPTLLVTSTMGFPLAASPCAWASGITREINAPARGERDGQSQSPGKGHETYKKGGDVQRRAQIFLPLEINETLVREAMRTVEKKNIAKGFERRTCWFTSKPISLTRYSTYSKSHR